MLNPRQASNTKKLDIAWQSIYSGFFSNTRLLDNIHDVKRLYCNAGRAIVTKKGYLKGYGTVSYHPKAISHILSLNNLQKKYKVTYNSSANSGCIVHKTDSNNCVFMSLKIWLIFSDIIGDTAHVLVNTGEKNRSKYMVKQYSQTNNVCLIQNIIGHPSTEEYINHVQKNVMTHLSRQAICEHKKVYQTDWHNTHHKRMWWTCSWNRTLYTDSKRKCPGNCKYPAIQILSTSTHCRNIV